MTALKTAGIFNLFRKEAAGVAVADAVAESAAETAAKSLVDQPLANDPLVEKKVLSVEERILESGLFDESFYAERYGVSNGAVEHYMNIGVLEGANPNPLFDTKYYLERYPDVASAGLNPLLHFLDGGAKEGRNPQPLFDVNYYLRNNPSLTDSGINPLVHFLREGATQKRRPHLLFDTEHYVSKYGDQIGDMHPLVYYLQKGSLTTDPHPLFDTAFYLEANPGVAASGIAPLVHFVLYGAENKLSPHPRLIYKFYAASYPGVVPSGKNLLEHYLVNGVNRPNFGDAQQLHHCIEAELNKPGRAEELFTVLREKGIYLLREHYFRPFVNPDKLPDTHWTAESKLVGINIDVDQCLSKVENDGLAFLEEFRARYPIAKPNDDYDGFFLLNGMYMAVDAHIYWTMVRGLRPSKIIEVGAGNSTMIAAAALKLNAKEDSELIVIEPYPDQIVKAGLTGFAKVEGAFVEDVDLNLFDSLSEGDILFIDSTHVIRQGGDVQHIYCEILPRIKPGVYVHVHDISLPKAYPRPYLDQGLFWTEQWLLQAYLSHNSKIDVVWPGNYLMCKAPERMLKLFPEIEDMRKIYPSSEPSAFWFRTK